MRKSRKNKYYSQNQEGGWPWRRNNSVAPEPNQDSIKVPWYKSLYHNPPASRGIEHYHEDIGRRPDNYSNESVIYDNIFYTKRNIKMARKEIQRVLQILQNEDEDIIRELKASSPEDYNYYIDGDNPRTIPNTEDEQAYLDELNEEYKKTNDYSAMLQVFANNYRKRQVFVKSYIEPYIEPYSSYREEISRHKADITSIRREIKQLLLHNKQQIKGTNLSFFQQYMVNYAGDAGELPRTVPQAIHYKESELIKLRQELISTQNDLEELKRLIESPIESPIPLPSE